MTFDGRLQENDQVIANCTKCSLALLAAACAGPAPAEQPAPAAPEVFTTIEADPAEAIEGPHARYPADWRVFVLEPLETQVAPGRFRNASHCVEVPTGDRLSRWPIYGAIITDRN